MTLLTTFPKERSVSDLFKLIENFSFSREEEAYLNAFNIAWEKNQLFLAMDQI